MDTETIKAGLRGALLTDEEISKGKESWKELADPFFNVTFGDMAEEGEEDEDEEDEENDEEECEEEGECEIVASCSTKRNKEEEKEEEEMEVPAKRPKRICTNREK